MTEFERAQCRREYAAAKGQASGNECIWQLGQWAVKYGDAALAAIDLDTVRADPNRVQSFLAEIMKATPQGQYIAVQYHPNGDWSVSNKTLDVMLAEARAAERERISCMADKRAAEAQATLPAATRANAQYATAGNVAAYRGMASQIRALSDEVAG